MSGVERGGVFTLAIGLCALLGPGCSRADAAAPAEKAADVSNPVQESELTVVRLSPAAEQRIDLATARVQRHSASVTLRYGSELVAIAGASSITAPFAGIVNGSLPAPGSRVDGRAQLLRLTPLVAAERDAHARAEREVDVARARLETAREEEERSSTLLAEGSASARRLEAAREARKVAEAEVELSTQRSKLVSRAPFSGDSALPIRAPVPSVVTRIYVAVGELVASGAKLVDLVPTTPLALHVPIYAADYARIDVTAKARVQKTNDPSGKAWPATPMENPPAARADTREGDLWFSLPDDPALFPGLPVGVELLLREHADSLVVPLAAVVRDVYGGIWVYQVLSAHRYARRRIEIRHSDGERAVLERGPNEGTVIVTTGASELFGVEFGGAH